MRTRGRALCLARHSHLVRGASESLAGRRRLDLAPLTCAEGRGRAARVAAGGYAAATPTRSPKPREGTKPTCAYVERIASAGVAADPIFTRRLLTMLAHQREPLNTTALANALSRPGGGSTIDAFTDLRCASSPTSTMWASASRSARSSATRARHLLNISTWEQLHSHPMRGATETTSSDLIRQAPSAPHAAALVTAAGEIDLILDRAITSPPSSEGRHVNARHARHLGDASPTSASRPHLIDPAGALNSRVASGLGDSLTWLPGEAPAPPAPATRAGALGDSRRGGRSPGSGNTGGRCPSSPPSLSVRARIPQNGAGGRTRSRRA